MRPTALPLAAACSLLLAQACSAPAAEDPASLPPPPPVEELAAWMTGSFSSARQATEAPDDYFDILLHMVPIWTERTDGPWLYVEQAAASAPEAPYRQRVYQLVVLDGGGLRVDIGEFPGDPLRFAGAWTDPSAFDALRPEDLAPRTGCSVHLERSGGGYTGSTLGEGCTSTLRGASYATSFVTITEISVTSWDRGFDAQGEQVWGPTEGPYRFLRLEPDSRANGRASGRAR